MSTLLHMSKVVDSVVIELAKDIGQLIGKLLFVHYLVPTFGLWLCIRNWNLPPILVLRLISHVQRARERRQTCFFLKFNLSHKLL